MRILVTGGTGFVGQRVVERLLSAETQVIVMSRRPQTLPRDILDKIESVSGDIRAFSDVMRVLSDFVVERIIHVAYTLTAEGEANPLSAIQANVLGTCNIFEAARIYKSKRVVFCSSIAAYAPQEFYGDRSVTEDEVLMKPVSIYGATKVLNEFMASRFEKRFGIEIPMLRIAAVYGTGREERGVTAWTSQMVSGAVRGKPVSIHLRPDQLASFIYVDDVAEQLVRLCLAEKLNYRIYNSGGVTSTPKEFAEIVKKYCPDADTKFDENAPPWPYPYKIDGKRMSKELNWEIREPEDGLLDQINQELTSLGLRSIQRKI